MNIRRIEPGDTQEVLLLMRELAVFEGYIKDFKVTATELHQRVFINQDFNVLVAETNENIEGILVYYYLPFSYDLTPWITMKELFVSEGFRHQKVGQKLMLRLSEIACQSGSSRIQWLVLKDNETAKHFYQSLGAVHNQQWETYSLVPCSEEVFSEPKIKG